MLGRILAKFFGGQFLVKMRLISGSADFFFSGFSAVSTFSAAWGSTTKCRRHYWQTKHWSQFVTDCSGRQT